MMRVTQDSAHERVLSMNQPNVIPVPGSPALSTLSTQDLIAYFQDRVGRWILKPAHVLLGTGTPDVDFAVLGILNAVPEMLAQYRGIEGSKVDLYREGILYLFPDRDHNVFTDEEMIEELMYGKLRCALAHSAFIGERILVTRDHENLCSILIDGNFGRGPDGLPLAHPLVLSVNVPEWYNQTVSRLDAYIAELSDVGDSSRDELRSKFRARIIGQN